MRKIHFLFCSLTVKCKHRYISFKTLWMVSAVRWEYIACRCCMLCICVVTGPTFCMSVGPPIYLFTDRVSVEGNAIGSVRPSVRQSVRLFSLCFWTDWPLNLLFVSVLVMTIASLELKVKVINQDQKSTQSVWSEFSINGSFFLLNYAKNEK